MVCAWRLRSEFRWFTRDHDAHAYRVDLVVEDAVLVEVKAVVATAPIHRQQLRTSARLAGCRVRLLLNFGAPTMREGIERVVNGFPDR